jgi:hypothetical protein
MNSGPQKKSLSKSAQEARHAAIMHAFVGLVAEALQRIGKRFSPGEDEKVSDVLNRAIQAGDPEALEILTEEWRAQTMNRAEARVDFEMSSSRADKRGY